MRIRAAFVLALVVVAITSGAAHGKGAVSANINGPGLGGGVRMGGGGESGSGTRLGALADSSGFWAQTYGAQPSPLLGRRPPGDLGPSYEVRYAMEPGGGSVIVQHIYPFADGGPLTFMVAGQRFWTTEQTKGGWFRASSNLVSTLRSLGVPKSPPSATSEPEVGGSTSSADLSSATSREQSPASSSGTWIPWAVASAAVACVLGLGAWILLRRRPAPSLLNR
jgi:hypothetical protein